MDSLAGDYLLTVVVERARQRDSIARGALHLERETKPAKPGYRILTFVLRGHSTIELTRLGDVTLSHAPSSPDTLRPGVIGEFNNLNRERILLFGSGPNTADAGVLFKILKSTPTGFRGTWVNGGRRSGVSGRFCAERLAR